MKEQVRNERLLRETVERFLQSPSLEQSILQSLSDVGLHLNVDRIGVYCVDSNTKLGTFKYEWCAKGVPKIRKRLQNIIINEFPWWVGQITPYEPMCITDGNTIPSAGVAERKILQSLDIKSLMAIPFHKGMDFTGFIGVTSSKRREYSEEEKSLLQAFTHIIAQVMETQQNLVIT